MEKNIAHSLSTEPVSQQLVDSSANESAMQVDACPHKDTSVEMPADENGIRVDVRTQQAYSNDPQESNESFRPPLVNTEKKDHPIPSSIMYEPAPPDFTDQTSADISNGTMNHTSNNNESMKQCKDTGTPSEECNVSTLTPSTRPDAISELPSESSSNGTSSTHNKTGARSDAEQKTKTSSQSSGKARRVALHTIPTQDAQPTTCSPSEPNDVEKSQSQLAPHGANPEKQDGQEEQTNDSASRKRPRSPSPENEDDDEDGAEQSAMPRPTVRLKVEVKPGSLSKSDYLAAIPELSVEQLETKFPVWANWYRSTYMEAQDCYTGYQSVGFSQQDLEGLGDLAKLLQKYPPQSSGNSQRKRRLDEYDVGSYDTKDPFVDDSELGLDEPTHIVKTRSDGFYVAQGSIQLARAKSNQLASRSASAFQSSIKSSTFGGTWAGYARQTNKLLAKRAAKRKPQTPLPSTTQQQATSSHAQPREVDHESATEKPKNTILEEAETAAPLEPSVEEPKPQSAPTRNNDPSEKKKNKYPVEPVHPQLQEMFDRLKVLVQRANFAVKTKFPPELKPPLIDTAKVAVELGEYNDNFFNYLPSIFPYNRFTMMKLTKREFFHKHMEYYRELQEEQLDDLYNLIQSSFPQQAAEYAQRHEKDTEKSEIGAGTNDEASMESIDDGKEDDEEKEEDDDDREVDLTTRDEGLGMNDSLRRFRWTDEMREHLFTIVTVENAMSEIRNEKLKLENSPDTYSEINARKALYKRIANFLPEGWMSTTQVSREYGLVRKRRDREALLELEGV
ncbi:hypothetical protein MYAM1_001990 [Malassezia yamatoensis]|uniref:Ubinuclein middle domain-containing protein n=1 Tax=Malassezia yamatoensis TaxID=253288 RepID=A0AAJ5YV29_9BASI|nr:hypothetical protein MYAM1_001990 [Malassezia yamatoensis]